MSRNFTARVMATAVMLGVGLLTITACTQGPIPTTEFFSGGSSETPTPELANVEAYPSAGRLVGVVGEGDSLACEPELDTLRLEVGNVVEYNGFFINYEIDMYTSETMNYSTQDSVTLVFDDGQPDIQAAIVRLSDFNMYYEDDGSYEVYEDPVFDKSVNWSDDLASANSTTFPTSTYDVGGHIEAIELCIKETPTPSED